MTKITKHPTEIWRERLAEEIHKRGIKITALSIAVGQNKDYISRVINKGTGNPSPTLFLKICREIGVPAGYILEGDDP